MSRNIYHAPSPAQPARRRKRWRICLGRHRIDKVERAGHAPFSLYKSMMSARPLDRAQEPAARWRLRRRRRLQVRNDEIRGV
jgi:hypothetical protein